jgi:beta-alanine--pyruvate transaminase
MEGPDSVAAVFLEPVQNSGGCFPPPPGYFQRVREICDAYDVLLVSDEVITGFGRTGQPFAAQTFGVVPDMITCAKGISNGCVPMGAVLVRQDLHDAFMTGPEQMIEFFHGYTYSAHPLACAAALGTLDTYAEEGLLTRASELQDYFAAAVHSLKGEPNVIDIRNIGLVGGIELAPLPGEPTKRAFGIFLDLYEKGLLVRTTGDTVALSPPLIIERSQIDQIVDLLRGAIRRAA